MCQGENRYHALTSARLEGPWGWRGVTRVISHLSPQLNHVYKVPFATRGDAFAGPGDQDVDIVGGHRTPPPQVSRLSLESTCVPHGAQVLSSPSGVHGTWRAWAQQPRPGTGRPVNNAGYLALAPPHHGLWGRTQGSSILRRRMKLVTIDLDIQAKEKYTHETSFCFYFLT